MYVCMYVCMYVSMYLCMYICVYVCMCVRMYVLIAFALAPTTAFQLPRCQVPVGKTADDDADDMRGDDVLTKLLNTPKMILTWLTGK